MIEPVEHADVIIIIIIIIIFIIIIIIIIIIIAAAVVVIDALSFCYLLVVFILTLIWAMWSLFVRRPPVRLSARHTFNKENTQ